MSTAVVVGGGPNGLAAAIALAAEGVEVTILEAADEVGGGARSSEAIVPGLLHDDCSAIHPMAVGSPFLSKFNLDRYGLAWRWPEVDCVHPLDGGSAAVLHRSVEQTAAGLGRDGRRWLRAFGYPASRFDALSEDIMGPLLRVPHHPVKLARFGAPTVLPASAFARVFRTEEGRALFGGVAAHTFRPLHYPMTSAIGMGIITAGHRHGWPVAEGGSKSITNAMVALLTDLGAKIETGVRVESASQLPPADVTMFDLAPSAVAGDPRRPPPAARFTCLHPIPARPGSVQSRLRRRWRSALDQPGRPSGRHRARGRDLLRTCRDRAGHPRGTHARAAVRAGGSAVSGRPATLRRQRPSAVDLRTCPERLHAAMRPMRSLLRSSGSRPASGTASSGRPFGPPPNSLPTTPTSSAATS